MVWQICHIWTTVTFKIHICMMYFKPNQPSLQSQLRQISFPPSQIDGASCFLDTPGASLEVDIVPVTSPLLLAPPCPPPALARSCRTQSPTGVQGQPLTWALRRQGLGGGGGGVNARGRGRPGGGPLPDKQQWIQLGLILPRRTLV